MKMKPLYPLLIVAAFIAAAIDSCSPTLTPVAPNTFVHTKTYSPIVRTNGILRNSPDTNVYAYDLSCGCAFPLKIDSADTTSITYNTSDFMDTIVVHNIKASARAGLASGQHTGWLAITTIQPITTELLKDTLRDTVIVP
jgi:hypothetical protein